MRRIVTVQHQASGGREVDTYTDRVIKYIPSDVVGAWVAITAAIKGNAAVGAMTEWVMFVIMLAIAGAWTLKQTHVAGQPPAVKQTAIATVAFAVWVFALGGPFASLGWYQPVYGSLALITYTLIVALIVP